MGRTKCRGLSTYKYSFFSLCIRIYHRLLRNIHPFIVEEVLERFAILERAGQRQGCLQGWTTTHLAGATPTDLSTRPSVRFGRPSCMKMLLSSVPALMSGRKLESDAEPSKNALISLHMSVMGVDIDTIVTWRYDVQAWDGDTPLSMVVGYQKSGART